MKYHYRADDLRESQKKLTQAANILSKHIPMCRSLFSEEEREALDEAERILRTAKNKVEHLKEKEIRAGEAAERLEKDVYIKNQQLLKRCLKDRDMVALARLYFGSVFCCDYDIELLVGEAEKEPTSVPRLYEKLMEEVTGMFANKAPHASHYPVYDGPDGMDRYGNKPYPITRDEALAVIAERDGRGPSHPEELVLLKRVEAIATRLDQANAAIAKLGSRTDE